MATEEEKEALLRKHQFDVLMKKLQTEAALGRVSNMHPDTRHKLKDKLEKTFDEKLEELPDKKKGPPEQLWKVYGKGGETKGRQAQEGARTSRKKSLATQQRPGAVS